MNRGETTKVIQQQEVIGEQVRRMDEERKKMNAELEQEQEQIRKRIKEVEVRLP